MKTVEEYLANTIQLESEAALRFGQAAIRAAAPFIGIEQAEG